MIGPNSTARWLKWLRRAAWRYARRGGLDLWRADSPRSAGRITREEFRSRLRRILSENFPDAIIESLTAAPDLEHSFSGLYVRGRMHEGSRGWAFLAVSPNESAAAIEGILEIGRASCRERV